MKSTLALAAAAAFAATAAFAQPGQGMQALRAACTADYLKLCAGVQPGGGRGFQCLTQHNGQLSAPCKSALAAAVAARKQADPPKPQ